MHEDTALCKIERGKQRELGLETGPAHSKHYRSTPIIVIIEKLLF